MPSIARLRDPAEYDLDLSAWRFDAPPVTREFRWTIFDAVLNPDGLFRPMMLINNQFPGPLVECNDGDRLVVHVENRAANATAIHFHGLFQNGSNFMDGSVGITQCLIAPNSTSTYRFDIRGQSGTYWYHAHHAAQASDGLVGPVVIHSRDEPALRARLDYVSDRIVMVQDHYHNSSAELLADYLRPGNENDEPVPDNALINGRGLRSCRDFHGWRCDGRNVSRPVFALAAQSRHRLRFINVGAFAEFQIQVDEHSFDVVEVDGTLVHPALFYRLNILPAQRYSIVLETNASASDAFWLRARMVTHCFTTRNRRLQAELWAVVRYLPPHDSPASLANPESKEWPDVIETTCGDLNAAGLRPVEPVAPPLADDFLALHASFMIGPWRLSRGFFNESTWHANVTHPSLHHLLDAAPGGAPIDGESSPVTVSDAIFDPSRELVVQTTGVRTVDISIQNFDDGAHPFHLHGHKFFFMAQGHGYAPAANQWPAHIRAAGGLPENPLRRDTATVGAYSWLGIRVVLDNPGLWMLHCHVAWHTVAGMVMQFLVRADVIRGWVVDASQRAMCSLDGVTRGTRPDDSIWFGSS